MPDNGRYGSWGGVQEALQGSPQGATGVAGQHLAIDAAVQPR